MNTFKKKKEKKYNKNLRKEPLKSRYLLVLHFFLPINLFPALFLTFFYMYHLIFFHFYQAVLLLLNL